MENQKIKILLDTIYAQPDLKDDVFNFINPIIIKAYGYLKQSDSNTGIGIEQKNALNNIIFKDIAKLIDIYISLPITYRNEKPIKNGKTHRQMLISNLELIAHKMSKIEDDIYEHLDREMAVKGRVLEDKYTDYVAFEKEDMLEKMEDSFQWNQVKTKLEFEYNKNIQSSFNSEKIFVKNGKKITNNTIKVSNNIKNKIKYYGKKGGNVISSMLKCFITPLVFIRDNILMITSALMIAFLYISIMFFMISDSDQKSAVKDIFESSSP